MSFSPGYNKPLPLLGMHTKKSRAYLPEFKSIKGLECDHGMDRCHYAAFQSDFNKVHTRNCSFKKKLKSEDGRRVKLDDKVQEMSSLAF